MFDPCPETPATPYGGPPADETLRPAAERDELVLQWDGLVRRVCKDVYSYIPSARRRLDPQDAEQEGRLGLVRAAELWDPARGVTFKTYAYRSVKTRIVRALALTTSIVSPPKYGDFTGKRVRFPEQAKAAQNSGAQGDGIGSWKAEQHLDAETDGRMKEKHAIDETERRRLVRLILKSCDKRRARILWMYYGRGMTLEDVGLKHGISKERVRQIIGAEARRMKILFPQYASGKWGN
jgi:RNA polymerase sigma factor (sigma-70 family)